MKANLRTLISMTESNQENFKVAIMVDEYGSISVLKNNTLRYLIVDFEQVNNPIVIVSASPTASSTARENPVHENQYLPLRFILN